MPTSPDYDETTDKALAGACSAADLDEAGFLRLAMACLDQGGLSLADQAKVRSILAAYEDDEPAT